MEMKDQNQEIIDPIKDIEAFEYTLCKVDGVEEYNPLNEANTKPQRVSEN